MPGKIYFAWVDAVDTFNPSVHNVEDEDIFSLTISQQEGEFARAVVEVVNPGQGLLNPARKKNVFISFDTGAGVELAFKGKLVGFPVEYGTETVQLEFIAHPDDWDTQQAVFLNTLKTAPHWNPLFVPSDRRNEAEEILAARSALLTWDRKTWGLALSDIVQGGTDLDLGGDFFFDSLSSNIGDPPVQQVDISIEVQWNQTGKTQFDIGPAITQEFTNTITAQPQINTLTPFAFEAGWRGVKIPSGYRVLDSALVPTANDFGLTQADLRSSPATVTGANFPTANGSTPASRTVTVPRVWYNGSLFLEANYNQKRRETMTASLTVNQQEITLMNKRPESISVRLEDPTAAENGSVLSEKLPSFFMDGAALSTAGQEAVEHALLRARAKLVKSSRVVETTFETDLDNVLDITLDHNIRLVDDRIPGGSMRGKVLAYELSVDGDSGLQVGRVTIGSVVGDGSDSAGSGTSIGAETYNNEVGAATISSAVIYEIGTPPTVQEPVDVAAMEADGTALINGVNVTGDGQTQNTGFAASAFPDQYLQSNRTTVTADLKSMNPDSELAATLDISTAAFTLPRQIDLEA